MASQVGMDNGQLMPKCELQNKGVSAGKCIGVLFSCQDIFLLILSLENLACFLSWEDPVQTRPAEAASQLLMLAKPLSVWQDCLLWSFSSFSSWQLWEPCVFIIPHLAVEEGEAQAGYWLCSRSHSLYVKLYLKKELANRDRNPWGTIKRVVKSWPSSSVFPSSLLGGWEQVFQPVMSHFSWWQNGYSCVGFCLCPRGI